MDDAPLIVVAVLLNASIRWFRSERDLWVLDVEKWRDEFVAAGYDVPEFTADYRYGIRCVNEHNAARFLESISEFEVRRDDLAIELAQRYSKARSWWDVSELFPIMFVDFDNHRAAAFYHEGTPMERYVPDGWVGEFVDFANEYPESVFPKAEKFWVKDDSDLLQLLNERGREHGQSPGT